MRLFGFFTALFILALSVFVHPGTSFAQTVTTTPIYTDGLQSGWTDASYNTTNTQVTTPAYQGARAIASTMNADGGLDFQSTNGFSTNGYTAIRFALRASQAGQQYEVYADATYGEPLAVPVLLSNYGGQPTTTGWTVYTIPLADLNASNRIIRNFVIHEARSTNEPVLYVDQVELVGTTPQTTVTPTPTIPTPPTPTPTAAPTPTPTPTPTAPVTPTPTSAPTPGGSTTPIYTDALQTNWTDASYNVVNTQVTTPVFQGTRAIATTMNADGGLDFQSVNGFVTNGFTALRFSLRASQAGQQYEVYADATYGEPLAVPVSLNNYGGQPTNTEWRTYTIPLADLNATNRTIRNFVIHEARSTNEPVLYVDQVELIGSATVPTPTTEPTIIATTTPTPPPTQPTSRKNIYAMTPEELTRFTNAVNAVRANGTYTTFMQEHMDAMMTLTQPNDTTTQRNVAHRGPSFLPWHRAFVREFELALQQVDPSVTIPYWSFEQETAGQMPRVFSAAYLGSDGNRFQGDRVTDGPFASWNITRRVGRDPNGVATLPTQTDIAFAMRFTAYDAAPYNESSQGFRNAIEGWIGTAGSNSGHNRVHEYVGGDMLPEGSAGNVTYDPVFWVVHANIDRLWAQWQQTNGITNYQPVSGGPAGHNLNDVMRFLNRRTTPADTLNIANMGYSYQ